MTIAAVVEKRFARVNEALHGARQCADGCDWRGSTYYAMEAVNMAGQYAKECSDLAALVREKGFTDSPALPRLDENAELFLDLRNIGLACYNESLANTGHTYGPEDFDLNDPRR